MSATKILWGQIITVFLIVLTAIWSATQWTASALAYQPELGPPWFMVGNWPIYPPPAFFWWWFSFDAYAPDIFQTGAYIAVSGGFMSITVAIAMSVWRARELKNAETYGSARWATEKEIRKAGLLGDNGVVLGQFERTYLRHDGPEHVLCYAPTRSGKGVGLVVPSLLTWPGSAIVHDIKGENWTLTAGFRARHGRVLLFDPTNALSAAYNPLLEVRRGQWEVRDVQNVADVLVDPEGSLLEALRTLFGEDLPIVISLDLHGILTDRMLRQIDGLAIYRTYPHVDFADTGRRAATLLLDIIDRDLDPVIARVTVPMLARGDECITRNGLYGDVLADAHLLEGQGAALAAGVMIGNPFTDAPELCTQAIVVAETDSDGAAEAASGLARSIWAGRQRLVGKLVAPAKAVALAIAEQGPVVFTDAADATSSGASGDSNVLIKELRDGCYGRRVLAQIVDPGAAAAAHAAGIGATIAMPLGGWHDKRFQPLVVTATIESLSRGRARLETMRLPLDAGPTAVITFENFTVLVMSRAVHLFDRAMYFANGLNPRDFDLTIVKSPHTEFHMYDAWASRNFNVDAPGSTSANLATLGHTLCARPIYPLEQDTTFSPAPVLYRRRARPSTGTAHPAIAIKGSP